MVHGPEGGPPNPSRPDAASAPARRGGRNPAGSTSSAAKASADSPAPPVLSGTARPTASNASSRNAAGEPAEGGGCESAESTAPNNGSMRGSSRSTTVLAGPWNPTWCRRANGATVTEPPSGATLAPSSAHFTRASTGAVAIPVNEFGAPASHPALVQMVVWNVKVHIGATAFCLSSATRPASTRSEQSTATSLTAGNGRAQWARAPKATCVGAGGLVAA